MVFMQDVFPTGKITSTKVYHNNYKGIKIFMKRIYVNLLWSYHKV